jgi:hypothetical protein
MLWRYAMEWPRCEVLLTWVTSAAIRFALFVPDVDFDSAWLAGSDKPSHLVERSWAAGDGLASDDRRHKDTH